MSVIMPVFNAENYLIEAIESVLAQTHGNFELIICFQTSEDDSLKVIKRYAARDSRIRVLYRAEPNLSMALNDGLKKARGKYIARMDADDICHPERLIIQLSYLERNPEIGVCGSWFEIFCDNGPVVISRPPLKDDELKVRALFAVPFAHPSVMIHSKIITEYDLYYDPRYNTIEDFDFWLRMSNYTKFGTIDKILLRYRYLEKSVSKIAEKDVDKRFRLSREIFSRQLKKLGFRNSLNEDKIHFILADKRRLRESNVQIVELQCYIAKLLKANEEKDFLDKQAFSAFLLRKYLIFVYFRYSHKKNLLKIVSNKLIYMALYRMIIDFLNKKKYFPSNGFFIT